MFLTNMAEQQVKWHDLGRHTMEDVIIYLSDLCFMRYLRAFHLFDGGQFNGRKKPGSSRLKSNDRFQVAARASHLWPEIKTA